MWLFFGFITAITASAIFIKIRFFDKWFGTPESVAGISYEYSEYCYRGQRVPLTVDVCIEVKTNLSFKLKIETWYDRLCKAIGISKEIQAGNPDFDKAIYVVADDPRLERLLHSHRELSDQMLDVFFFGRSQGVKEIELHCRDGRLWCWCKIHRNNVYKQSAQAFRGEIARRLLTLSNQLQETGDHLDRMPRDSFYLRAVIILSLSSMFAIYAISQGIIIHSRGFVPFVVDLRELLVQGFIIGTLISLSLVVASIFLLGRSSRTHLVILELLIICTLGAGMTSSAILWEINVNSDVSSAISYTMPLEGKETRVGARKASETSYHLKISKWPPSQNNKNFGQTKQRGRTEFQVDKEFFDSVNKGDNLIIKLRDGYLGYRWVESIESETK